MQDKVFSALVCLAPHEHDLLQAVEHHRPDMPRALSDEVLQPRPLDMPEAQEDFDTIGAKHLAAVQHRFSLRAFMTEGTSGHH